MKPWRQLYLGRVLAVNWGQSPRAIVQKKILSPNDFATTAQLAATLLAFIDRYNHSAQPFNCKLTATDLARLLQQISAPPEPASLPQAA